MVKQNKLSAVIIILSICLLLILGYISFFKEGYDNEFVVLNDRRASFIIEGVGNEVDLSVEDDGGPIIAVVVDGVGLLDPNVKLDLPSQISLGMPSYVPYKEYANNKYIMKHNILLNIPLEPLNYPENDADPNALLIKNSNKENLDNLNLILDRSTNYNALYTSYDDRYTDSYELSKDLLSRLKNGKVIYLSGLTDKNALIYQVAEKMNFYILENDIVLDSVLSKEDINTQLLELERIAQNSGSAIAIGGSYPLTMELLNDWVPSLASKGIKIVPIQDFYKIISKRKALLSNSK
ncbi:MAG: divergent polysaccharide deacetylase family protein [Rickettsiales bacterium]|jgi:polysaccharide deacetylase 2 family uncharacterized protein YibQ|nr:divergent polysaccharide deacetylase family protein [Rickettsiales bacterium]